MYRQLGVDPVGCGFQNQDTARCTVIERILDDAASGVCWVKLVGTVLYSLLSNRLKNVLFSACQVSVASIYL